MALELVTHYRPFLFVLIPLCRLEARAGAEKIIECLHIHLERHRISVRSAAWASSVLGGFLTLNLRTERSTHERVSLLAWHLPCARPILVLQFALVGPLVPPVPSGSRTGGSSIPGFYSTVHLPHVVRSGASGGLEVDYSRTGFNSRSDVVLKLASWLEPGPPLSTESVHEPPPPWS